MPVRARSDARRRILDAAARLFLHEGVRSVGIAYSEANALGSGLREERDAGLTEFGRLAVRRMNRLGIAIDVSHAGDQTSLDTIERSEHPVFVTHAGARGLWNTKRMKPDTILRALHPEHA